MILLVVFCQYNMEGPWQNLLPLPSFFYLQKISFVLPPDKAVKNACVCHPHQSDHRVAAFYFLLLTVAMHQAYWSQFCSFKLEPSCYKKRQKSLNEETGLGNRRRLKVMNNTKLVPNEHE